MLMAHNYPKPPKHSGIFIEDCSFCKGPSNAHWSIPCGTLYLCKNCAMHELPRFMADAITPSPESIPYFFRGVHRISDYLHSWRIATAVFMQAVAYSYDRTLSVLYGSPSEATSPDSVED